MEGLVIAMDGDIVPRMNLIQIGQPIILTVQQLIEQMAAHQSAEIEQLKQAATARQAEKRFPRPTQRKNALTAA